MAGDFKDYAEELAITYGMPYYIMLRSLKRMLSAGVGIAPPIVVSDEEYEFLQGPLEEGSDDEGES